MAYQTKITDAKTAAVKALSQEFEGYNGFIFTDYRGLTVDQITAIRKELRTKQAAYRVVKNRFAKIALADLEHKPGEKDLVGPTAIALVKGDEGNVVAKILFKMANETSKLSVKGAILDNEYYDAASLEALSKLPGKLELISSLMATMKAPVQKLAATLLAYVEKLDGGASAEAAPAEAAPAAAEAPAEAPAEEAPAAN